MGLLARMVVKDLRRKVRAPTGLIVALSFPVLFAMMLALVFGSKGDEVPKIRLLLENRDDGILSGFLTSALTSSEASKYLDVKSVGADGAALMEKGQASALLRIPKNFTRDMIDGTPTSLQLVRNPAEGILPEITEQLAGILTDVLDTGSRVLRRPLDEIRPYVRDDATTMSDDTVSAISVAVKRTFEGAGTFLAPPAITLEDTALEAATNAEKGAPANTVSIIFLLILPGVSVYALFLIGDQAMADILVEAASGTLRRQLAGPVRAGALVLQKALYAGILSLLALLILSAIAAAVLRRGVDVVGFAALSLALILAIAGTSATIYGATGTVRRGATLSSALYLLLAFAGGSFINLESLPGAVRAVAPLSPFYWGTSGYRTLMEKGGGLADVLPGIAVLAAIGLAGLSLGGGLLSRLVRKGTV